MIGRKLRDDEDHHLVKTAEESGSHLMSSEVFHESGEKFKEGIKRNEGVFKHYFRHVYMIVGMFFGVSLMVKFY